MLRTAMGVHGAGVVTREVPILGGSRPCRRFALVEHPYRFAMVLVGGGLWPSRSLQAGIGRGDEVKCLARKRVTGHGVVQFG